MSLSPGYPGSTRLKAGVLAMAEEILSAIRSTSGFGLWGSLFTDHPRSLGESYWKHQRHALEFGVSMIRGGLACIIHALLPGLFARTASTTVLRLHDRMIATRRIDR
jgi:hypothetical protein